MRQAEMYHIGMLLFLKLLIVRIERHGLCCSSQLSAWTGREVSNPCDPEEYAAELNKLIEAEGKFPVREYSVSLKKAMPVPGLQGVAFP